MSVTFKVRRGRGQFSGLCSHPKRCSGTFSNCLSWNGADVLFVCLSVCRSGLRTQETKKDQKKKEKRKKLQLRVICYRFSYLRLALDATPTLVQPTAVMNDFPRHPKRPQQGLFGCLLSELCWERRRPGLRGSPPPPPAMGRSSFACGRKRERERKKKVLNWFVKSWKIGEGRIHPFFKG